MPAEHSETSEAFRVSWRNSLGSPEIRRFQAEQGNKITEWASTLGKGRKRQGIGIYGMKLELPGSDDDTAFIEISGKVRFS